MNKIPSDMSQRLERRLETMRTEGKDTIGDILQLQVVECNTTTGEFLFRGKAAPWMRNLAGTLHGGMCATFIDQCLGLVARCLKDGQGGLTPTLDMALHYLRPLMPDEDVLIRIQVLSVSRSIIHMGAQAYVASKPEKLCISANGTSFFKETK